MHLYKRQCPIPYSIVVHLLPQVTLTCTSASSNPLSRISWTRNGAFVRDHREETLGSVYGGMATKSKMSLLVTSSDDKSQFTCLAKSDEFKTAVTDSLTLRIRRKCSKAPSISASP
ncbi:nephrin [Caerostris darwini]|uniref:Nephrin n=1 Tax=Caerostris darwini TaxID=1538125 RepID=A0AAV4PZ93_9ARAC|nr:nephrin [Caerostris darwini]